MSDHYYLKPERPMTAASSDRLTRAAGEQGAAAASMSTQAAAFDAPFARRWYAVQSQPRRESLALVHLKRQGFTSFCPARSKTARVGRRRVSVEAPFFPGYLFVELDLEADRWRSINGTIGVLRLVSFGASGRPAPLPVGFIEKLRDLYASGAAGDDDDLRVGDNVRVVGGPFDDLCGVLENKADGERVTILLSLLGKETRVSLKRRSLIAA